MSSSFKNLIFSSNKLNTKISNEVEEEKREMKRIYIVVAMLLVIGCGGGSSSGESDEVVLDTNTTIEEDSSSAEVVEERNESSVPVLPPAESLALYQQAKEESRAEQYQFAIDKGATFHTTPDAKSFYLEWYPEGVSAESKPPMIVTISGHGGWVFAEFYHWQSHAAERGYGIISLQWWFGTGEGVDDYYLPREMYPIFEDILKERRVDAGKVLLHGFSRGSANIYGVTLYDRLSGNNFFALTVANSGKAEPGFTPNNLIEAGEFGATPLDGTHWVTVCGKKDIDPNHTCDSISKTNDWIRKYGGAVELFIQDEEGGHEAFYTNPSNIDASLDVFESLILD